MRRSSRVAVFALPTLLPALALLAAGVTGVAGVAAGFGVDMLCCWAVAPASDVAPSAA